MLKLLTETINRAKASYDMGMLAERLRSSTLRADHARPSLTIKTQFCEVTSINPALYLEVATLMEKYAEIEQKALAELLPQLSKKPAVEVGEPIVDYPIRYSDEYTKKPEIYPMLVATDQMKEIMDSFELPEKRRTLVLEERLPLFDSDEGQAIREEG